MDAAPLETGEVQVAAPSRESSEGAEPPLLVSALWPEELSGGICGRWYSSQKK